jgi:hypothetical protein
MGLLKPTTKDLAILVLSNECGDDADLNTLQDAAARTFDRLRVHLSERLGARGYYALIKRAVTLASTDFPWLLSVRISEDGHPDGFQSMALSESTFDACVSVLARLIELLDTFIGRSLTARILNNAWPNAIQVDTTVDWLGENNG